MARTAGLGKGLGALIPTESDTDSAGDTYRELALGDIDVNQFQPRTHFDDDALESLTASVREFGVLQPILVREKEDGRFELVAGERRVRAARDAGLQAIPAIVRVVDDQTSLVQAVVENIHREDLNPLEEAAAYQQLLDDFDVTHEELATRLGKGRATISNTLRLLQLSVPVQRALVDGEISAGHARALLACPDEDAQVALVARIAAEGLSVRAVEQAVRDLDAAPVGSDNGSSQPGDTRPPAVLELEALLAERLATNVRVSIGSKRGRVTIDFATLDDLERIYHIIQGEASSLTR